MFMGGSSCLGLSFIEFKLKWLEYRFRACGLRPQLVHLMDSNNTTIHCWVPWRRTGTNNKSEEEEEEAEEEEEEEDEDDDEDEDEDETLNLTLTLILLPGTTSMVIMSIGVKEAEFYPGGECE